MTNENMTNLDHSSQIAIASGINVLLGIWLVVSPWFYGYATASTDVTWNSVIVGLLIVICAAVRSFAPLRRAALSGVNILLGIWVLLSPWVYGYSADVPRLGTNVVVGIVVIALAIWSGGRTYVDRRQQRHA
jgi:SPW repeat